MNDIESVASKVERRIFATSVGRGTVVLLMLCCAMATAQKPPSLSGRVLDGYGRPVAEALVQVGPFDGAGPVIHVGNHGGFTFQHLAPGNYVLTVRAAGFQSMSRTIEQTKEGTTVELQIVPAIVRRDSIVVTAEVDDLDLASPDPAEKVFAKQDLIDANPGRPGAPVSIPGYPIETASSGIKAPQYFAPGVAGDHGEPIAQFLAVGSYLLPNNLSANAHGNGYADPNIFIPGAIESVKVDGGAFNVREGNHSLNLAVTYGLRPRLDTFLTLTGDSRDLDLAGGFSPSERSLVAFEASFGNGFLDRLEHRQQYKLNTQRVYTPGQHVLTLLGIAYYGTSYIPGLVPLFGDDSGDTGIVNLGDTIDPRQRDQTHTAMVAANDSWRLSNSQQFDTSGFFRTYNLALFSNFGQGLIRQSEFRTVVGQSTNYRNNLSESFSLLTGFDYNREAPRRDNLDHYGSYTGQFVYGPFVKVDSSDVTIASLTPYGAAAGGLGRHLRYYAGWRRDQIDIANDDLIDAGRSFQRWVGVNSPKATVSFVPGDLRGLPLVSASAGEAFFTEDPRIALGSGGSGAPGSAVARSHNYQLVLSKDVAAKSGSSTDVKLTLGHVTSTAELAKIDPDTGLQQDQGPSRLRFLTATVRHTFAASSVLATFSKADARDLDSGSPTPEAPRTIFDLLGNAQRLPLKFEARVEFEFVGRKPLGTGCLPGLSAQCVGTSVREFRAALARPLLGERLSLGLNLLIASGYSGQTIENFGTSSIQEVVGVRVPSYVSGSFTYRFGGKTPP
jgi:hypothetical protein